MKPLRLSLLVIMLVLLTLPSVALAQTYSFSLDQEIVHVFWNEDGTVSIDYVFVFTNEPYASPIDYVDVGLLNSNFNGSGITADVNGIPINDISRSGYQGSGDGVALGLASRAIQPGETGVVHIHVPSVSDVLYEDSTDSNYASGVFSPTWFGSQYVTGQTDLTVTFHLPPGVQPEEPRWHAAPSGWMSDPVTGIDENGRITYTWSNPRALGYEQYKFGASFPMAYVPSSAIVRPSFMEMLGISEDELVGFGCCCFFGLFIVVTVAGSYRSSEKRKLQYLPPKIAIEGHGIKRGLTAVEAAILMEQPLDKVLTMILFGTLKKGAASVTQRDPLELDVVDPLPEGLRAYEEEFLKAFKKKDKRERRVNLQTMMINLVKSLSKKMKGFSRRETVAYYKNIMHRAWVQVEAADTPEVKSEKYDQVIEWTMLDDDYDDRTRRVFTGPVYAPVWWGRYDPGYRGTVTTAGAGSSPSGPSGGGSISMPHLPGSDFAASIVTGVEGFSSSVVGNVTDFTSGITQKTNPVPVSTSSGGRSSGGGCACACACAGCACACAGGGR